MEKNSLVTLSSLLMVCCNLTIAQSTPNIIFILTDDQRYDAIGYAGNKQILTPALDSLARQGVFFRNAFATTPISAASRASILTGLHERTHGYTFEQGEIKPQFMNTSYPIILKEANYYTGFFGKLGVDYVDSKNLFDEAEFFDRNSTYSDNRAYFYKTIGTDTVHLTHYTSYKAMQFISKAPSNKPFYLSIHFSAPHAHDLSKNQYFWDADSDNLYKETHIPAPALSTNNYFEELPDAVKNGFNHTRWAWRFDTPEKYQQMVKGYYRMITDVDREVFRIRELLAEKGFDKNTIIIFASDNGYFLGERQLADKWLMYDLSIRIPLIVYDPRYTRHLDVMDLVANVDIPATILSLAGCNIPKLYQGKNLDAIWNKKGKYQKRDDLLCEHLWNNKSIPSSEGLRTKRWKYFRYRNVSVNEYLYDLSKDINEEVNLATLPKYKTVLQKLRQKCEDKISLYSNHN